LHEDTPSSNHIQQLGGWATFCWRFSRFLATATLLGLSVFVLLSEDIWTSIPPAQSPHWLRIGLTAVYAYSSVLALTSVATRAATASIASAHVAYILLLTWGIFIYRDLWPLATFTLEPLDSAGAPLIWVEIGLVSYAAVVVPLSVPRQYIPVDPKNPAKQPNPEQTACLFSLILYNFLDPLIFLAYRVPHLPFDDLPPLADYDETKNLVARSFPHLDPFQRKKRSHLFFGLMRVFCKGLELDIIQFAGINIVNRD